jgi:outer membrane protein, heavy metal efflux system
MSSLHSRLLGAAVVAALGTAPVLAQEPDTLSLGALLAAVDAAPALRAAGLSAQAAAARARAAGFRPDPEVEAMVWPVALLSNRMGDLAMLRARQMLPYPSQLRSERAAAEARAEAAGASVEVQVLDRRLAVRQAYYDVYRTQALDALVRAFQRRLEVFAEAAAIRYEVGRGPQGAILQAQLERDRLEAQLRTLATLRQAALSDLAALVGTTRIARLTASPAEVVALPPRPGNIDSALVAETLTRRAEFRALDAERRGAEADVALARQAFRPELGVMAALGLMSTDDDVFTAAPGVGVMVRLPLNRPRLQARLEEAQLRGAEVEARRAALAAEVEAALVQHAYTAQREAETLDLYRRRLLPQAAATAEAVLAAYTTGQAGFLDLLDAERTRFELSLAAEEARYRYLVALADLEHAAGRHSHSAVR